MTTDLITVKQVTKTYGSKNKEIAALKRHITCDPERNNAWHYWRKWFRKNNTW